MNATMQLTERSDPAECRRFHERITLHTAVLLVNLGSPDAPTPAATRRYLREFLTDPRVIELPRWLWRPILELAILPRRPKASAAKYAQIWTEAGSPLTVATRQLAEGLQALWGESGPLVRWAMRYGNPNVRDELVSLQQAGVRRLLVVPLYPQYCASTTGSVFDAVTRVLQRWRDVPEVRFVRHWHDHPVWVERVAATLRRVFDQDGEPEQLLFSFHGMPLKTLYAGDPYHCECQKSARLIAEALRLPRERWQVTFQSRFGPAKWLQPYTQETLEQLARSGVKRVAVVCPGFVADCLETLEEIAIECREAFLAAGGEHFTYVPCLNADPEWILDFATILTPHLSGWPMHTRVEFPSS
jgi:ferrochelatase